LNVRGDKGFITQPPLQRQFANRPSMQAIVRIKILACCLKITVPEKVLKRYDVIPTFQKPSGVCVTEFVQSCVGHFGSRCDFLEPAQKMINSPAFRIRKDLF
jgi:hypothetical protein